MTTFDETRVVFPSDVAHLRSGAVARLLGVGPRAVAQWERLGLITASVRTKGGHRRFAVADVQAFLHEVKTTARLTPGDIVSCRAWADGRPVRVLYVTRTGRYGLSVRWQDVAAHSCATNVPVSPNRLVRILGHREAA